jgi:hypothetical protein
MVNIPGMEGGRMVYVMFYNNYIPPNLWRTQNELRLSQVSRKKY